MSKSVWVLTSGDEEGSVYAVFERAEDCPVEAMGALQEVVLFGGPPEKAEWFTGTVEAEWLYGALAVAVKVERHDGWPWYSDGSVVDTARGPGHEYGKLKVVGFIRGPEELVRRRVAEMEAEYRGIPEGVWTALEAAEVALAAERKRKEEERDAADREMVRRQYEMQECAECRKVQVMTSSGSEPCERHREYGRYIPRYFA